MFNPKQFESKVYAFVTREFNKASQALTDNETEIQINGVQFHKAVIRALHSVTEEISVQCLCGLITLVEARYQKAKSVPLFQMKALRGSDGEKNGEPDGL